MVPAQANQRLDRVPLPVSGEAKPLIIDFPADIQSKCGKGCRLEAQIGLDNKERVVFLGIGGEAYVVYTQAKGAGQAPRRIEAESQQCADLVPVPYAVIKARETAPKLDKGASTTAHAQAKLTEGPEGCEAQAVGHCVQIGVVPGYEPNAGAKVAARASYAVARCCSHIEAVELDRLVKQLTRATRQVATQVFMLTRESDRDIDSTAAIQFGCQARGQCGIGPLERLLGTDAEGSDVLRLKLKAAAVRHIDELRAQDSGYPADIIIGQQSDIVVGLDVHPERRVEIPLANLDALLAL